MLIFAEQNLKSLNHLSKETFINDAEQFNGCGVCVAVCPHAVFEMNDRKTCLIHQLACMECGACQLNCVTAAIKVESGVGWAAAMLRVALLGLPEAECC